MNNCFRLVKSGAQRSPIFSFLCDKHNMRFASLPFATVNPKRFFDGKEKSKNQWHIKQDSDPIW